MLLATLALPMTAYAQGTLRGAQEGARQGDHDAGPVGAVVGATVGAVAGTVGGILGVEDRPRFREYVVREHHPSYRYDNDFRVGAVLPESGVIYYDVPADYHVQRLPLHLRERSCRAGRSAHAPHRSDHRLIHNLEGIKHVEGYCC